MSDEFPCESRVSTPEYLEGYENMTWGSVSTEDEREPYEEEDVKQRKIK